MKSWLFVLLAALLGTACGGGGSTSAGGGNGPASGSSGGGTRDGGAGGSDAGAFGDGGPCVPTTCAALGKNCGTLGDGCSGTLSCGTCVAPQACGGDGFPNVCGAPTGQSAYYVSAAGDDANSGTTPSSPWKTIAKVNSATFAQGDMILFRGGDELTGQLAVTQPGLFFGSYGGGPKPILTGAVKLTGWKVHAGSIYVTTAPAFVRNLFADGNQMILARYPDTGFLTAGGAGSSTVLQATGIIQPAGTWNGGTLRMKTTDWCFESRKIASSSPGKITVAAATDYTMAAGWGFYLDDALAALDAPGEWYGDPTTNQVYFYAPNGVDPNTLTVEGSALDFGISGEGDGTTVTGLTFRMQSKAALSFAGSPQGLRLIGNDIRGVLVDGIDVGACTGCVIDGNSIEACNGNGITISGTQNQITNNVLQKIGLVPGYGRSGTGGSIGIATAGSQFTISGNRIDGVGYAGITPRGSGHVVEKNVIKNTMQRLADGGAIYSYGKDCSGGVWRQNIVEDVPGTLDGSVNAWTTSVGLYVDQYCHDTMVEGNTVIRAGSAGIYVQFNDANITMKNNLVYDCGKNTGGKMVQIIQGTLSPQYSAHGGHVFTGNTLYPTDAQQTLMYLEQEDGATLVSPGVMDGNHYCNPYDNASSLFRTVLVPSSQYGAYTLAQWQGLFGQDPSSKDIYTHLAPGVRPEKVFVNEGAAPMSLDLSAATYRDLDGNATGATLVLAPYTSVILIQE
jgi:parallel beta-helix repeat protein